MHHLKVHFTSIIKFTKMAQLQLAISLKIVNLRFSTFPNNINVIEYFMPLP